MDPLLTVNDLFFRRDDFIMQIDSLELHPGEIYLLHGQNGSGKSTLLHLLALLLMPDHGEIRYQGVPVEGEQQRQRLRKQITLVEQRPFLFRASVYQNLAFGLRLRDVRGALQRQCIAEALHELGLENFECRNAHLLSGGETRRVAIARAIALKPRLLLLDEPTAELDRKVLPLFEQLVFRLQKQGTTVVIASHDPGRQRWMGGKNLYLDYGRLTPENVSPANPLWKEIA